MEDGLGLPCKALGGLAGEVGGHLDLEGQGVHVVAEAPAGDDVGR